MEITMIGSYLFSNFKKHFSVHAGNYNCIKISLLVFWSALLTKSQARRRDCVKFLAFPAILLVSTKHRQPLE